MILFPLHAWRIYWAICVKFHQIIFSAFGFIVKKLFLGGPKEYHGLKNIVTNFIRGYIIVKSKLPEDMWKFQLNWTLFAWISESKIVKKLPKMALYKLLDPGNLVIL